jgi:hypothetical protein
MIECAVFRFALSRQGERSIVYGRLNSSSRMFRGSVSRSATRAALRVQAIGG